MDFALIELSSHSELNDHELQECFEADPYFGELRHSLIIAKLFDVDNAGCILNIVVPREMYRDVKLYLDSVGVWNGRMQVFTGDMDCQFGVVRKGDVPVVTDWLRARAASRMAVRSGYLGSIVNNIVLFTTVFQVDPYMMMMHNSIHANCQAYMTDAMHDLHAGRFLYSRELDWT